MLGIQDIRTVAGVGRKFNPYGGLESWIKKFEWVITARRLYVAENPGAVVFLHPHMLNVRRCPLSYWM